MKTKQTARGKTIGRTIFLPIHNNYNIHYRQKLYIITMVSRTGLYASVVKDGFKDINQVKL